MKRYGPSHVAARKTHQRLLKIFVCHSKKTLQQYLPGTDIPSPFILCILRAPPIAGRTALNALNATPGNRERLTRNSRKETMNRTLTILTVGASLFACFAVPAQAASDVSLARFDCGTPQAPTTVNQRFSDTYAYGELKIQFVFSCYLIKHGDHYLLWDTGHALTAPLFA
jgi:hypothetical protein